MNTVFARALVALALLALPTSALASTKADSSKADRSSKTDSSKADRSSKTDKAKPSHSHSPVATKEPTKKAKHHAHKTKDHKGVAAPTQPLAASATKAP